MSSYIPRALFLSLIFVVIAAVASLCMALLLIFASAVNSFAAGEITLPQTGQTTSYAPGDDGAIQAGLAWSPYTRFTDNGDGTLSDNLTGVMWLKDARCVYTSGYSNPGLQSWDQAFDFVNKLNDKSVNVPGYTAAYNDWRVPNVNEMECLIRANSAQYSWLNKFGFVNFMNDTYTTSTTVGDGTGNNVWVMNMTCGHIFVLPKAHDGTYVVPVRGTSTDPAVIWKTGQTQSYMQGDDGDYSKDDYGASWNPLTRFIDNTDGTVTDTLTGLMWTKSASNGYGNWSSIMANMQTLNNSNFHGYSDWRVPNRKELRSLVDYSQSGPALSAKNPFTSVGGGYWTSSHDSAHGVPWYMDMSQGGEIYALKDPSYGLWPVRNASGNVHPVKDMLTVNKAGVGSGTITSSPTGINCGASCNSAQGFFDAGAQVTLAASPAAGFIFNGWSGDASGSQNPINIAMTKDMNVTASFILAPDMLSLGYTENGTAVTLNATLRLNGSTVQGQQVQFFETTTSGKTILCGKATTGADGSCQKKVACKPGATYTWYAKTVVQSLQSIQVSCTIGKPTLTLPLANAVVNQPNPSLSWEPYNNAIGYDVQVSNKSSFPAKGTLTYHETGTYSNAAKLTPGKKCFWRVIADLPDGTSMPSDARAITYKGTTSLSLAISSITGSQAGVQASLTDFWGNGLQGRKVKITGGKKTISGVTDAGGLLIKTVPLPLSSYSLKASFSGDGSYEASESSPVSGMQ